MQDHDWNDLKYVLAVHRTGTLAGAGRALAVNETTVARRLKALETGLEAPLFLRANDGRYQVTDLGLAIVDRALKIEDEHSAIGDLAGRFRSRVVGTVRITSVPMVINQIIVPQLNAFSAAYPDVTVELVPHSSNLSLSRREVDIALRLARPETGGTNTKARRLGALGFAAYSARGVKNPSATMMPWIGYDDENAHLPQAHWISLFTSNTDAPLSSLRVSDVETAREAVAAGLGQSLLPCVVAMADARLERIPDNAAFPAMPSRDIWMISHDSPDSGRRCMVAAKTWLSGIAWS